MSERGTFVTSFLYDWKTISPILAELLPKMCRPDGLVSFRWPEKSGAEDQDIARWFAGIMHGSYSTEESWQMEQMIGDELLPALPENHGKFSIAVLPEGEEGATVFTIHEKQCVKRKVGPGEAL